MWFQWCLHFSGDTKNDTTVNGHNVTHIAFKNCAPFTKYIKKIDWTTIDDAEKLNLVMLTGSLWIYSKDEASNYENNVKSFE